MRAKDEWGGTAVITGGTKGIGLAIAVSVAPLVDEIILVYHSDDRAAESAKAAVEAGGAIVSLVKGDVTEPHVFDSIRQVLDERTSYVSLLVHGAVDTSPVDLLTSHEGDIEKSMAANGFAFIRAARAVDPFLQEGSLVVFLSSKGAVTTLPGYAGIGVPKAMAEAAMRYLAIAWAPRGVRAVVLAPGAVDTDSLRSAVADADGYLAAAIGKTPAGRLATPQDVADAVVLLRSSGFATLTGERIRLDGGLGLV